MARTVLNLIISTIKSANFIIDKAVEKLFSSILAAYCTVKSDLRGIRR